MTIPALIEKQDTVEIVRDQIAAILATEVASQKSLATSGGKDPRSWDLRIFSERSNPWAEYIDPADDQLDATPIVNVSLDAVNFDASASNAIERQKATATYNIDCYGYGIAEDDPAGGHHLGDARAAMESHRAVRLVRNILMAGEYTYLGLRGTVWRRWPRSVTVFQPTLDGRQIQQIVASRIAFDVDFSEFSPQVATETLELLAVTVFREETGEVYLNADFGA